MNICSHFEAGILNTLTRRTNRETNSDLEQRRAIRHRVRMAHVLQWRELGFVNLKFYFLE